MVSRPWNAASLFLAALVAGCVPSIDTTSERLATDPIAIVDPVPGASYWTDDPIRIVVHARTDDMVTVSDGTTQVQLREGATQFTFETPGWRTFVASSAAYTSAPVRVLIKDVADACVPSELIDVPETSLVDALVGFEVASSARGRFSWRELPLAEVGRDRAAERASLALRLLDRSALATLSRVTLAASIRVNGVPAPFSWSPTPRSVTIAWTDDEAAFELAVLTAVGAYLSIWTFPGQFGGYRSEALRAWSVASPGGVADVAFGRGLDIDPASIDSFGVLTEGGRSSIAFDIGSTLAHLLIQPDRVFHHAATNTAIGRKVALVSSRFGQVFGMDEAYFRCLMYAR